MRLSDALMIGRHTITAPKAFDWNNCAIPMALNAVGQNVADKIEKGTKIVMLWPWLHAIFRCPWCGLQGSDASVVFHPFDTHVMGGGNTKTLKRITFEELVDWIRSIEPDAADAALTSDNANATQSQEETCVDTTPTTAPGTTTKDALTVNS